MFIEENMADNDVNLATSQTTEGQAEETTQAKTETTAEPVKTEVQGEQVTETQAFSKRLNEKIDAEYDRLFGAEYGVHSKAEYDKAIADQQAEQERQKLQDETGIDPDKLKPIWEQLKQNDPNFQELASSRAEKRINTALSDLNAELKEVGSDLQLKDLSDAEVKKLDNVDKIISLIKEKGYSLADAYFIANKKTIIGNQSAKAQQETIKKIVANGASSPGSLSGGTETETLFTKEQVQKMTKEEVQKNYDQILKSTRKW
jgi:hypothetical protein